MSNSPSQSEEPQVEDPGEYNQRQRLREIAQARRNARKSLADMYPEFSDADHRRFALKNVQALAAELEWLVRENGAVEYFEQELGPITLHPPSPEEFQDEVNQSEFGGSVVDILGNEHLEEKTVSVQGLYSTPDTGMGFIDLSPYVTGDWSAKVDVRHKGPTDVSVSKMEYVPLEVSMAANRLCRKFINDAGLDARIEKERDDDPNPI